MMETPFPPKAAGLRLMQERGITVPDFRVLFDPENALIRQAYDSLKKTVAGVSLRSAAWNEDQKGQANAGQYRSFNALKNLKQVQLAAQLIQKDYIAKNPGSASCPMILQTTLPAWFSGVTFVEFPSTATHLYVEANYGSCRTVVDGLSLPFRSWFNQGEWTHKNPESHSCRQWIAHPDLFILKPEKKIETGKKLLPSITPFPSRTRLLAPTSDHEWRIYGDAPDQLPKTFATIQTQLLEIASQLKNDYPQGLDMEWGVDTSGTLHLFQVRSLTRPLPSQHPTSSEGTAPFLPTALSGLPASSGQATGVIIYPDSTLSLPPDTPTLLMLAEARVEQTHFLNQHKGVISAMGGILSHLAIVCREQELPCVVGVQRMLPEGSWVCMNGNDGTLIPLENED